MIKKIDIMGIGLDNYTVRESMRQVENYLSNDVLNTIENISMQMLIASETDPVVHSVISELDLSVIGEKEILKAADADSMRRRRSRMIFHMNSIGGSSAISGAFLCWDRRRRTCRRSKRNCRKHSRS